MSLFCNKIQPWLESALNERQDNSSAHREGWFYQKTPWVRMISNAVLNANSTNPDSNTRLQWVLYAGRQPFSSQVPTTTTTTTTSPQGTPFVSATNNNNTTSTPGFNNLPSTDNTTSTTTKTSPSFLPGGIASGFSQMYDQSNFRPMPGITQVEIKNKGNLGALREATISYKCWTLEQLNYLEKLYMVPGITCFLEWGWSMDFNGNPIIPNRDLATYYSGAETENEIIENIRSDRELYKGNYDAFLGIILNFQWSLNEYGGFDCETTLCSKGEVTLALDTKTTSMRIIKNGTDDKDATAFTPNLKDVLEQVKVNSQWKNTYHYTKSLYYNKDEKQARIGFAYKPVILTEKVPGIKRNYNKEYEYYITWGYLEYLITKMLCPIKHDKTPSLYLFSGNNTVYADPEMFSTDCKVCLMPGFNTYYGTVDTRDDSMTSPPQLFPTYGNNVTIEDDRTENSTEGFTKQNYAYISKLMVNVDHIIATYDSTEKLDDFLKALLDSISQACGGIWEFSLMVDEHKPDWTQVIDNSPSTAGLDGKPTIPNFKDAFKFVVYNKNSIVKSVALSTKIDAPLKGQIMFGTNKASGSDANTRHGDSEYNFYGGHIKDIFYNGIELPPRDSTINSDQSQAGQYSELSFRSAVNPAILEDHTLRDFVRAAKKNVENDRSDSNVSAAQKALNNYLINESGGDHNKFLTLPLTMNVTMDGISGFKWGDMITTDYLLERYITPAGVFAFQIKDCIHNISPETWDTTIDTYLRVIGDPPKEKLSSTANVPFVNTSAYTSPATPVPGEFSTYSSGDGGDNNPFDITAKQNNIWPGQSGIKTNSKNPGYYYATFYTLADGLRAGMSNLSRWFVYPKSSNIMIWPFKPTNSGQATLQFLGDILSGKTMTPAQHQVYVTQMNIYWPGHNVTNNTILNFNGKTETNSENIKMFKAFCKSVLYLEGGPGLVTLNAPTVDSMDISTLI